MVTLIGETFASRVAASLLRNVGLELLNAHSFAEYEALALALAHDRPRLAALRRHLRVEPDKLPLFDSPHFTRGLEAAYRRMWKQFSEGKAPEAFDVRED